MSPEGQFALQNTIFVDLVLMGTSDPAFLK
jgi:hypothetical protein